MKLSALRLPSLVIVIFAVANVGLGQQDEKTEKEPTCQWPPFAWCRWGPTGIEGFLAAMNVRVEADSTHLHCLPRKTSFKHCAAVTQAGFPAGAGQTVEDHRLVWPEVCLERLSKAKGFTQPAGQSETSGVLFEVRREIRSLGDYR